jgi:thiosulfate/3-mercaptopyruvate sulfurtransferase
LTSEGRKKWLEEVWPIIKDLPTYSKGISRPQRLLVDVRSQKEFTGEIFTSPEYAT